MAIARFSLSAPRMNECSLFLLLREGREAHSRTVFLFPFREKEGLPLAGGLDSVGKDISAFFFSASEAEL